MSTILANGLSVDAPGSSPASHALSRVLGFGLRLLTGWTMLFLITLAVFFFLKVSDQVSRGWLIGFYFAGAAALLSGRIALMLGVRHLTRNGRSGKCSRSVKVSVPALTRIGALPLLRARATIHKGAESQ